MPAVDLDTIEDETLLRRMVSCPVELLGTCVGKMLLDGRYYGPLLHESEITKNWLIRGHSHVICKGVFVSQETKRWYFTVSLVLPWRFNASYNVFSNSQSYQIAAGYFLWYPCFEPSSMVEREKRGTPTRQWYRQQPPAYLWQDLGSDLLGTWHYSKWICRNKRYF